MEKTIPSIETIAKIRRCKATKRIALNQPITSAKITAPKAKIEQMKEYEHLIKLPTHDSEITFIPGEEITAEIQE